MRQMTFLDPGPPVVRDARFSACGTYRYWLTRDWAPDPHGKRVNFIMLNPSVADADADDPTVRRCEGYARAWNFPGMIITNLYGLVATDPRDLLTSADPVGPDNDVYVKGQAAINPLVCVAWGRWGAPRTSRKRGTYMGRGPVVLGMLDALGVVPVAFGVTTEGQPLHPLYLPKSLDPVPWPLALARGPGVHKTA